MATRSDYNGGSPDETRLSRILEHEAAKTERNRAVRQQMLNAVMGYHPRDDRASQIKPWLKDMIYNPLWKDLQWMTGQMLRRPLSVKIFPRAKTAKMEAKMMAAKREWQIRATMDSMRLMQKVGLAFDDAAMSGQGWMGVTADVGRDGRMIYKAKRYSWASEFGDSNSMDDDMRESKYHFSIRWVDLGQMQALYPEVPGHVWDSEKYGAPAGRDFLDFSSSRGWGGYFGFPWHTATGGELWGEWDERPGIAYGKCWYEAWLTEEKRFGLMQVPFILSRSGMKLIFLREPKPAWAIPRQQVVSARNPHNGDPFSPRVLFANGIDRAMHYQLRAGLDLTLKRRVKVGMNAIPKKPGSAGEPIEGYDPVSFKKKVDSWEQDGGVLLTEDPNSIVIETEDAQVQMAMGMMDKLIQMSSKNSPVHAALMGERSSVSSGVAMRELTDNVINSENRLFGTALRSVQDAGEWLLLAINQLEKWSDFGAATQMDGSLEEVPDRIRGLQIGPDDLKAMRLGFSVTPVDRTQVTTPERWAVLQELVKVSDPNNPVTGLWAMSMIDPGNPHIAATADHYIRNGIFVPDIYLRADQIDVRDKAMQAKQQADAEEAALSKFERRAKGGKDAAEMMKKLVEAGMTADAAEQAVMEFDGRLNPQGGGGGKMGGGENAWLAGAGMAPPPGGGQRLGNAL